VPEQVLQRVPRSGVLTSIHQPNVKKLVIDRTSSAFVYFSRISNHHQNRQDVPERRSPWLQHLTILGHLFRLPSKRALYRCSDVRLRSFSGATVQKVQLHKICKASERVSQTGTPAQIQPPSDSDLLILVAKAGAMQVSFEGCMMC
jgi:hypothetical protein